MAPEKRRLLVARRGRGRRAPAIPATIAEEPEDGRPEVLPALFHRSSSPSPPVLRRITRRIPTRTPSPPWEEDEPRMFIVHRAKPRHDVFFQMIVEYLVVEK